MTRPVVRRTRAAGPGAGVVPVGLYWHTGGAPMIIFKQPHAGNKLPTFLSDG